jgi:hypothetical protein
VVGVEGDVATQHRRTTHHTIVTRRFTALAAAACIAGSSDRVARSTSTDAYRIARGTTAARDGAIATRSPGSAASSDSRATTPAIVRVAWTTADDGREQQRHRARLRPRTRGAGHELTGPLPRCSAQASSSSTAASSAQ